MKIIKLLALTLLASTLAIKAVAHHSTANFNFNEDARETIQGVVTYWSFTNPHSFVEVDVTQDDGSVVSYTIFLTSRVALQRYGWRPSSLNAGDKVEIEGSPDYEKPNEMYLQRIVFADGKEWRRDAIAL